MKSLVIYTSQTGFTKQYAEWLAERLNGQVMELKEAKAKNSSFFEQFDSIVYGGWAIGGKCYKSDWFMSRIDSWKEKKLAVFVVGASPNESDDIQIALDNLLNEEQKQYVKAFYCQGGLSYERMKLSSKIAMKMFAAAVKKKDADIAEAVSKSYDISNVKYLDPIVEYLEG